MGRVWGGRGSAGGGRVQGDMYRGRRSAYLLVAAGDLGVEVAALVDVVVGSHVVEEAVLLRLCAHTHVRATPRSSPPPILARLCARAVRGREKSMSYFGAAKLMDP